MCSGLVSVDGFSNEVYSCVVRLFCVCIKYFSFVSIYKYLLTAGQWDQALM